MKALPFESHQHKIAKSKGNQLSPEALRIKKIALRLNKVTNRDQLSDRE
ncbi:hypothetical protein IT411_03245, partial [Candidatus Peregrinibacteria bacterium]|nr:hypothetical protein [Candidatus Peregrinibacteria bacterium]